MHTELWKTLWFMMSHGLRMMMICQGVQLAELHGKIKKGEIKAKIWRETDALKKKRKRVRERETRSRAFLLLRTIAKTSVNFVTCSSCCCIMWKPEMLCFSHLLLKIVYKNSEVFFIHLIPSSFIY
jgi:hypothetical protein